MIVLDASAAVSWLLNEGPASELDRQLAERLIVVPSHWTIEVGNAIVKALRRSSIEHERLSIIESNLAILNPAIEPPLGVEALLPLVAFASEHGLSTYDAGYVQLAWKRVAALASFDQKMRRAAERLGVQLIVC